MRYILYFVIQLFTSFQFSILIVCFWRTLCEYNNNNNNNNERVCANISITDMGYYCTKGKFKNVCVRAKKETKENKRL